MISSEVQRTLVKSPPELWAEISDPESLARHLGEFGEIRITRVQPEQKVEWEADEASGTVVIKPSGWGTKVKLTVMRELAALAGDEDAEDALASADEPQPAAEREPEGRPQPDNELELEDGLALEAEPKLQDESELELHTAPLADAVALEAELEPADGAEEDVEPALEFTAAPPAEPQALPEPEPRRGFFARLFGRRRRGEPAAEPSQSVPDESESGLERELELEPLDEAAPYAPAQLVDEPEAQEPEGDAARGSATEHEPAISEQPAEEPLKTSAELLEELPAQIASAPAEGRLDAPGEATGTRLEVVDPAEPDDASARTKLAEELAAAEVTAVLTGVLDRLGAAHHRPFSRA